MAQLNNMLTFELCSPSPDGTTDSFPRFDGALKRVALLCVDGTLNESSEPLEAPKSLCKITKTMSKMQQTGDWYQRP